MGFNINFYFLYSRYCICFLPIMMSQLCLYVSICMKVLNDTFIYFNTHILAFKYVYFMFYIWKFKFEDLTPHFFLSADLFMIGSFACASGDVCVYFVCVCVPWYFTFDYCLISEFKVFSSKNNWNLPLLG